MATKDKLDEFITHQILNESLEDYKDQIKELRKELIKKKN